MVSRRTPCSSSTGYQKIAAQEANKLGIPVVGVVDTNHTPDGVDYVIPATTTRARRSACTPAVWPDAIPSKAAHRAVQEIVKTQTEEFVEAIRLTSSKQ